MEKKVTNANQKTTVKTAAKPATKPTPKTVTKSTPTPKPKAAVKSTPKTTAAKPATAKTVTSSAVKTINRKTMAKTVVKAGMKPRIAMFIDVDNVGISRENLMEILFFVNGKYKIEMCKLYGFSEATMPGIKEIATEYNLLTVGKMKFKTPNTNCLDSRLLVDAYECAMKNSKTIDTIFIWCYPCDLAELFEKIVALGVTTATIDNRLFDCKNKFVSQTFKIYSDYAFGQDNISYGQIQNSPEPVIEPKPQPIPAPEPVPTPTAAATPTPTTIEETLDGKSIPVLPRREVLERHSVKPAPNLEANSEAGSVVSDIAKKLNLALGEEKSDADDTDEFADADEEDEIDENDPLIDLMRRAGFMNDANSEKKYEDTIGDL